MRRHYSWAAQLGACEFLRLPVHVGHRFKHDGTYDIAELAVAIGDEERPAITTIFLQSCSPVAVEQTIGSTDEMSNHWKVPSSITLKNPVMEGVCIN